MCFSGFMVQLWPRDRVKSAAPTPLLPLFSPIKGSIPFCTPSHHSSNLPVNLCLYDRSSKFTSARHNCVGPLASDPFCPATRSPPLRCSRPRRITPIGAADALCHRRGRLEADAVLPSTFLRAVLCSSPPFESSSRFAAFPSTVSPPFSISSSLESHPLIIGLLLLFTVNNREAFEVK
jgi:hypothetical protein